MTAYSLERAWVDGAVRDDVLIEVEGGGDHFGHTGCTKLAPGR